MRHLHHQCHGTDWRCCSVSHFQGQANEQEILPGQFVEVAELLDHANPSLEPNEVRRPPPLRWIVHSDEIGTKERDLAVDQPPRRLGWDIRSVLGEAWL